jgi:CRISPR system Cascade subunit CasE
MHLSRVLLPLANAASHAILADVHALHRTLMAAFPTPAGRMLFRIEPANPRISADDAIILVQSEDSPRWFGIQPLRVMEPVKQVSLSFSVGQRFRFRLRANPCVKQRREGKRNGARVPVLTEERRFEWLVAKGKGGGFEPQPCLITDEKTVTGAKIVGGHALSFRAVLFEGTLSITDAARFRETVESGIGSGKAFGFGLLSLAAIQT